MVDEATASYERFLQGDSKGLEELVHRYNLRLIRFLNGYVKDIDTAQDLAADTFAELLARKSRFSGRSSFQTWLFQIGRHNALDYLRRKKRRQEVNIDDIKHAASGKNVEDMICQQEQKRELYAAISTLKQEYMEVVLLLYFEGMSYEQAGKVMHKSQRQIKNLAYRAKQALKERLKEEGTDHAQ